MFTGAARSWAGGSVANIVRQQEQHVQGYAVGMRPEEIEKLDVFEGYPHWYTRI